jgi:hypothetical protein
LGLNSYTPGAPAIVTKMWPEVKIISIMLRTYCT